MMTDNQWKQFIENHEIVYLRADICLSSPESYTLNEKRKICEDMEASTAEADAAMRADFNELPDFAKLRLLEMLGAPGTPERAWWERILLDFDSLPDRPPKTI